MNNKRLYIPAAKLRTLFPMQSVRRRQRMDVCTPFDAWLAACIYTWRTPFITPEAVFHTLGYSLDAPQKQRQRRIKQISASLRILKKKGLIESAAQAKTGQFRIVAHFPKPKGEFYTMLETKAVKLPAHTQITYFFVKAVKTPVLHWKQIAHQISPQPHAPKKTVLSAFEQLVEAGLLAGHLDGPYIILHPLKEKFSKT